MIPKFVSNIKRALNKCHGYDGQNLDMREKDESKSREGNYGNSDRLYVNRSPTRYNYHKDYENSYDHGITKSNRKTRNNDNAKKSEIDAFKADLLNKIADLIAA